MFISHYINIFLRPIFRAINARPIFVLLLFLIFTGIPFGIYLERTLGGNINHHILPAEMFGIPSKLKERGLTPLYVGPNEAGWDGQFYFYMANDIFARGDTAEHLDQGAYRYQRIGLSLYTALVSKILFSDWVSPKIYFFSYACLILVAVWIGAKLFQRNGVPPFMILMWGLGVGTQITLFNGLPDGAADAFFIIALPFILVRQFLFAAIPLSFSILSREAYIIFPISIFLAIFFDNLRRENDIKTVLIRHFLITKNIQGPFWLLVPPLVFVFWWIYIFKKFSITPSSQAHGILNYPLMSWLRFTIDSLQMNHKLFGSSKFSNFEATALIFFFLIIASSFTVALITFLNTKNIVEKGLSLGLVFLIILYLCFGDTVMMHYTGYDKVLGIFYILVPIILYKNNYGQRFRIIVLSVFFLNFLLVSSYNYVARIAPYSYSASITGLNKVVRSYTGECYPNLSASVKIINVTIRHQNIYSNLFASQKMIVDLELENKSDVLFESFIGKGGIFMSYQWIDPSDTVIRDGIRTAIVPPLQPNDKRLLSIITDIPSRNASLILSPVQEGCIWFHSQPSGMTIVGPSIKVR
jgi:hypothetical protein